MPAFNWVAVDAGIAGGKVAAELVSDNQHGESSVLISGAMVMRCKLQAWKVRCHFVSWKENFRGMWKRISRLVNILW